MQINLEYNILVKYTIQNNIFTSKTKLTNSQYYALYTSILINNNYKTIKTCNVSFYIPVS